MLFLFSEAGKIRFKSSKWEPLCPDSKTLHQLMDKSGKLRQRRGALAGLIELGMDFRAAYREESKRDKRGDAKEKFLRQYGWGENTPLGYEVHHVIPLMAGGADDPKNMILVEIGDHEKISAELQQYFQP